MIEDNQRSFWEWRARRQSDFLIVGGGIVGLSAAIFLKEANANAGVTLVERDDCCGGASTRNAGFACFGSPSEILDDLKDRGEKEVLSTINKRYSGLELLLSTVNTTEISFENAGGYELLLTEKEEHSIRENMPYLNELVANATKNKGTFKFVDVPSQISSRALVFNELEGQLDPFLLIRYLRKKCHLLGIDLINGWEVKRVNDGAIVSKKGEVLYGNKTLVCTNAYTRTLFPEIDCKPVRNQVFVTKPIEGLEVQGCFHYDRGYVYFRNIDNRILIGGSRNTLGIEEETDSFGITESGRERLRVLLNRFVPIAEGIDFDYAWSGILGVSESKEPIIKAINKNTFLAVRMGGMGVAIGMKVGKDLADLALGQTIEN